MVSLWNEGWKRWSGLFSPDTFAALAVFAGMFCFWCFYIVTFVLAGVACIIVSSTFCNDYFKFSSCNHTTFI